MARPELPAAVAADRDRHRLVALGVERLEHRARGGERDVVLARPAAGEHGDADAPAHGNGDGGGRRRSSSVVVVGRRRRACSGRRRSSPSSPASPASPAAGPAESTKPSSPSSVVSSCSTFTLKPDASSWLRAVCSSVFSTFGTPVVCRALGHRERDRRSLGREVVRAPASGRSRSLRRCVGLGVLPRDGEAERLELRRRGLVRAPAHVGDPDRLRPARDVDPHLRLLGDLRRRPSDSARSRCPGAGCDEMSCTSDLRFMARERRHGVVARCRRRRRAPTTCALPVETQSSTKLPLPTRSPWFGFWSKT